MTFNIPLLGDGIKLSPNKGMNINFKEIKGFSLTINPLLFQELLLSHHYQYFHSHDLSL